MNLVENNVLSRAAAPSIWQRCCIIKSSAAALAFNESAKKLSCSIET
jgi:hypothetical protein